MKELTIAEIDEVSGAGPGRSAAAAGAAAAIGVGAFGASWGMAGVGVALAVSPLSVFAMAGLVAYAGYSFFAE